MATTITSDLIIINDELAAKRLEKNPRDFLDSIPANKICDNTDFLATTSDGFIEYSTCSGIASVASNYHHQQSNILMNAGLRAYAHHLGYELSPDQLWYMIVDTLAAVINNKPKDYSHLIDPTWVEGTKKKVEVRNDLQTLNGEWLTSIGLFEQKLTEFIPEQTQSFFVTSFTTTNRYNHLSNLLCLMDAGSSFFSYGVNTMCGVESIRVKGKVCDYKLILDKLCWIELQFGDQLQLWINQLRPVLEKIIASFKDSIDQEFWGNIIKVDNLSGSGSTSFNGWLGYFTGYTSDYDNSSKKPIKRIKTEGYYEYWNTSDVPTHLTCVPFVWNNNGVKRNMKFIGGALGVQYLDDAYLVPEFGIAVASVN